MQKIVPNLWYDNDAEQAAQLYVSLIPGSEIRTIARYPGVGQEVHGRPEGSVLTVDMRVGDTELVALNGGPHFRFTPAISLFVMLEHAKEVDRLWNGLVEGGQVLMPLDRYAWSERYGWLADRWGLTWQIALGRHADVGQTVTPSLLFGGDRAGQAEAAIERYVSIFPQSEVVGILRHDGNGMDPAGTVQHAQFRLSGTTLMAMDSAEPHAFGFNEAVSLLVQCTDQAEIDRLWTALSAVSEAEQCGWLKDRFGISWQIVPRAMSEMMARADAAAMGRLFQAFLPMKKLDAKVLERAFTA